MDSASDASELPPLYHGLIYYDQGLHGTPPRKIQSIIFEVSLNAKSTGNNKQELKNKS